MQVESLLAEILGLSKCKGLISDGETARNMSYTVFPYRRRRRTFSGYSCAATHLLLSILPFFFNKVGDLEQY